MIQCADPKKQNILLKNEISNAICRVIESGKYILGPESEKFELTFSEYCKTGFAIGVNSGTDALILALKALDIGPGDEVITVSHTALATVAAIIATGATPVLVDIEPVYFTLDPECFKKAISKKTKAIIPVHLYGQVADMEQIISISRNNNIAVIEDCAQATGATYKNKRVGSMGDIGCFSFYPTKNLGAIGDAGAVVTSDEKIATRIKELRQYGWDNQRSSREPGINSRIDEIQAAVLNVKIKKLDTNNIRRREIANLYNKKLSGLDIQLPNERNNTSHVYHLYVAKVNNRDEFMSFLEQQNINLGIHYPNAVHQNKGYLKKINTQETTLSNTEKLIKNIVSLPMYPELIDEEVDLVISAIKKFLK